MEIGGLQKVSLIDYPGRIAATVFIIGCNFRCPWCYSRELVLPEEIQNQPRIPEKDFFNFLEERKELLEGVTICGGEPTIHKELPNFIKQIKKMGYLVKLDTNGSNPQMLKKLISKDLIDYVSMDVKAPRERYEKVVGGKVNLKDIEKTIEILKKSNLDFEFRTTLVPTLIEKKDVLEIAQWIKLAKRYYLQNFRPEKTIDPKFKKIKPYPQEYLIEIQKAISPFFEICQIRQ